jgi:hypothetical protein
LSGRSFVATPEEVAALIHARVKDTSGNILPSFTGETRPTVGQVEDLIAKSVARVRDRLGGEIADVLALSARELVAIRVAMLVELSYFGDQIQAGRSPYDELKALHDDAWAALLEARKDLDASGQPGGSEGDASAGLPSFAFPPLEPCRTPTAEIPGPYVDSPYWPYTCRGPVW